MLLWEMSTVQAENSFAADVAMPVNIGLNIMGLILQDGSALYGKK